ncbi:MAG: hypothetical protein GW949_05665 [Spirochaetales bacterium]|nr:hypothetical protein [Spirochaetales bacterium]
MKYLSMMAALLLLITTNLMAESERLHSRIQFADDSASITFISTLPSETDRHFSLENLVTFLEHTDSLIPHDLIIQINLESDLLIVGMKFDSYDPTDDASGLLALNPELANGTREEFELGQLDYSGTELYLKRIRQWFQMAMTNYTLATPRSERTWLQGVSTRYFVSFEKLNGIELLFGFDYREEFIPIGLMLVLNNQTAQVPFPPEQYRNDVDHTIIIYGPKYSTSASVQQYGQAVYQFMEVPYTSEAEPRSSGNLYPGTFSNPSGAYRSIELLSENRCRITAGFSPYPVYSANYYRSGNRIIVTSDQGDLEFEIIDSNTLRGIGYARGTYSRE